MCSYTPVASCVSGMPQRHVVCVFNHYRRDATWRGVLSWLVIMHPHRYVSECCRLSSVRWPKQRQLHTSHHGAAARGNSSVQCGAHDVGSAAKHRPKHGFPKFGVGASPEMSPNSTHQVQVFVWPQAVLACHTRSILRSSFINLLNRDNACNKGVPCK